MTSLKIQMAVSDGFTITDYQDVTTQRMGFTVRCLSSAPSFGSCIRSLDFDAAQVSSIPNRADPPMITWIIPPEPNTYKFSISLLIFWMQIDMSLASAPQDFGVVIYKLATSENTAGTAHFWQRSLMLHLQAPRWMKIDHKSDRRKLRHPSWVPAMALVSNLLGWFSLKEADITETVPPTPQNANCHVYIISSASNRAEGTHKCDNFMPVSCESLSHFYTLSKNASCINYKNYERTSTSKFSRRSEVWSPSRGCWSHIHSDLVDYSEFVGSLVRIDMTDGLVPKDVYHTAAKNRHQMVWRGPHRYLCAFSLAWRSIWVLLPESKGEWIALLFLRSHAYSKSNDVINWTNISSFPSYPSFGLRDLMTLSTRTV